MSPSEQACAVAQAADRATLIYGAGFVALCLGLGIVLGVWLWHRATARSERRRQAERLRRIQQTWENATANSAAPANYGYGERGQS